MKHTPPATEPIVLECELPQSPALVWRALTEPDLLRAWLLPNDLRPEVGARFRFTPTDRPKAEPIDCEVLEAETNRTLRWRQVEQGDADSGWRPVTSVVTIELTDSVGGGTHFRLVHDEFKVTAAVACLTTGLPGRARAAVIPFRGRSSRSNIRATVVCQLRRAA
jgi:uncharacterized protein YndB with AHSA1/START domain